MEDCEHNTALINELVDKCLDNSLINELVEKRVADAAGAKIKELVGQKVTHYIDKLTVNAVTEALAAQGIDSQP